MPSLRLRGDDNQPRKCWRWRLRLHKQRGAEAASELRLTRQGLVPQVKAYPGWGACRTSRQLLPLITDHGAMCPPKTRTNDRNEQPRIGTPSNQGGSHPRSLTPATHSRG